MGSHSVNVEGDLVKVRLSKDNQVLERIKHDTSGGHGHDGHGHGQGGLNLERVKQAF